MTTGGALVLCTGGGIGDVLLATPVMRALQSKYGRVVALTTRAHRAVLDGNPALDDVWDDDAPFLHVAERIVAGRFDASVTTWATLRSAALPFVARIPARVGQARRLYSTLFTHRVVVRSERGDRSSHWTQILLDFARVLNCDDPTGLPSFSIPPGAAERVRELLTTLGVGTRYVVLHPTRGISSARHWPTDVFARLATRLAEAHRATVVVTGAASDIGIAEEIARLAQTTETARVAVSVAGKTSLGEFAALAAGALAVIAMDSGPMHVAAAVGVPTLGIFALRSDEPLRWAPLGPNVAVTTGTYPCPPNHRKETCPDFACIEALSVEDVVRKTLKTDS